MATQYITKRRAPKAYNGGFGIGLNAAGTLPEFQVVVSDTQTVKVFVDTATAQTLTNKTLTTPTLTAPVVNGAVTGTMTLAFVTPGAISFAGVVPASETAGSLVTTGSTWVSHSAVGACAFKLLCASSAASGDYATMRIRGRADAVSSGGVEGINVSASTTITNYTNLCAGYFAAQPNAITSNAASGIISAIHAVVDRTGASSGRTWVAWIDTHQETKSGAGDYLCRLSHNGTVANDGCFTIYNGGRMPFLFNFEDAAGFLTDAGSPGTTAAGFIAVKTPAGTKYLSLFTA